MLQLVLIASALGGTAHAAQGLSYNGLALTPQMGWNNWQAFGCNVDADLMVESSNAIVKLHLKDLGYEYVVMDDCWSNGRDDQGKLRYNETRFPKGIKGVSDHVHSLGLKWGMYSSAGRWTCGGYEGSLDHEKDDAQSFADWGVDYLKYDNCFNEGRSGTPKLSYDRYKAMSDALNATGRPILYSICNWGDDSPWNWASTISNSWRTNGDLYDTYDKPDARCPCDDDEFYCMLPGFMCSMMNTLNKAAHYVSKAQPGGWNDLDILQVGNGGMTDDEYVTEFSMWAALKSPLLMGMDLRKVDPKSYSIYTNPAVIAINQDPAGSSAARIWRYFVDDIDEYGRGEISLWSGALDNGDQVVALVNAGNKEREMNATLSDIFGATSESAKKAWDVYDLWGKRLDDKTASKIIANNGSVDASKYLYNATKTSYAEGIKNNDPMLFGTKVDTVQAQGTLKATVARHGVGFFRLRPNSDKTEL
uniref:Alpha-galactosidase n=1 Tax=Blastobotrys adeninivorans TaxID=409370 RepID=A0A060T7P8_BLAAD